MTHMKDFTKDRCRCTTNKTTSRSTHKKRVFYKCKKRAKYIMVKNRGKNQIFPLCTVHTAFIKAGLKRESSRRFLPTWFRFIKI